MENYERTWNRYNKKQNIIETKILRNSFAVNKITGQRRKENGEASISARKAHETMKAKKQYGTRRSKIELIFEAFLKEKFGINVNEKVILRK